jgi:hypothetical protein
MTMNLTLTSRQMEERLSKAFDADQTAALVEVLDRIWELEVQRAADSHDLRLALTSLANAQERTEKRIEELAVAQGRTEQRIEELAVAQTQTEQRLNQFREESNERWLRIETNLEQLTQAQRDSEVRLTRVEVAIGQLVESQNRMQGQYGNLNGRLSELTFTDRVGGYLGGRVRRLRVMRPHEIEAEMEAELLARLPAEDVADLYRADRLISGRLVQPADALPIWFAVEVSAVVDRNDVERAQRRANALRRAGYRAVPLVAGERMTAGAEEAAQDGNVLLLQNGRTLFWDEALADALSG